MYDQKCYNRVFRGEIKCSISDKISSRLMQYCEYEYCKYNTLICIYHIMNYTLVIIIAKFIFYMFTHKKVQHFIQHFQSFW